MMVTAVTAVDKRKCKVFLEEDFAFVLYRGEVEKFHIEEGQDLSQETYADIELVLLARARERALYLLQSQGRTQAQIERKLRENGYPVQVVERVVAFLREYHFVDDGAYTENYIHMHKERKSRRQMVYELKQKGVEAEEIERVLTENPVDEEQSARSLILKRLRGRIPESYEEKCRLSAYLGRKGFSYDIIRRVLDEVLCQEP